MDVKVLKKLEYDKIIEQLIDCAISPMGKELCKKLIPSIDLDEIVHWQKETQEAVSQILKKGSIPLGGVKDIRPALKRAAIGAELSIPELLNVADTLRTAKNVQRYAREQKNRESYEILEQWFEDLYPLENIQREIFNCIKSEEEIDDNASATLRNIRREIKSSHDSVRQQLHKMIHSNTYKNVLQDSVVTMRDNRYCIPVKQEYRSNVKGLIHDQSSTGSTLFIEPMAVVQLNNHLKELFMKEKAEIERIIKELSILVAGSYESITVTLNSLTQLDFIFAKGQLALKLKASQPIFNDRGYVNIRKGRHPLLDPETVVPIDINIGKDFSTLVITGPNTGGKTVTLKTVGLLTLMGQAGLQIPAFDRSELAVFSNIFADIGDEQSIEQSLSTFSSHMVNIVDILNRVTFDSLVLFDELGAGTDPTEGAALAMSILQSLHKKYIRTVATTHYSELKVYALSTKGVENASCEFDVETLRPTYRLLIGIPGKSNAFAISKRLGLNDEIIGGAKELLEHNDVRFEDLITDLEINKKSARIEQEKAVRYRKEAEELKEKLKYQKKKIEDQKQKILRQAREEARRILHEAKDDADTIIKDLNKAAKVKQKSIDFTQLEGKRSKLRDKLSKVEEHLVDNSLNKTNHSTKKPKNLQLGDKVYLNNFEKEAIVLSKPDNKGNLMVQTGIMKININLSQLSVVTEKTNVTNKTRGTRSKVKTNKAKAQNISTEIDVRGRMVEEALSEVDKYLDDAYLSNLATVTIIHGKGTGALRAAVSKYLKKNSHVESYRLGKYGEGESGVTVVELKQK